jgi:hypothetical protein
MTTPSLWLDWLLLLMSLSDPLDPARILDPVDLDALTATEARVLARGLRNVAALPAPTVPDRQAAKALNAAADALDAVAAHRH